MHQTFQIKNRTVGAGQSNFIIAELSCNHNQNYDLAVKTIQAMKKAGADAVKMQVYTPDTLTLNCDNKYFQIRQGTLWDGTTLYKLYQQAYTPWEWFPKLKELADELGLIFFASAFDETAVDLLEKISAPAYKVASFEIRDLALIKYMAKTGKPIIISTGIASLKEIQTAVKACHQVGNRQIILLKCTSAYPTPIHEVNLATMVDMQQRFKTVVGVSDHTLGDTVAIASAAMGGHVIEKHFILDRKMGGPDSAFSMEPAEFAQMVKVVRDVELAIGQPTYVIGKEAKKGRQFSRSLFVVQDIKKGERFTRDNVRSIRPGFGLAPEMLTKVLGKKAKQNLHRGTPLRVSHFKA